MVYAAADRTGLPLFQISGQDMGQIFPVSFLRLISFFPGQIFFLLRPGKFPDKSLFLFLQFLSLIFQYLFPGLFFFHTGKPFFQAFQMSQLCQSILILFSLFLDLQKPGCFLLFFSLQFLLFFIFCFLLATELFQLLFFFLFFFFSSAQLQPKPVSLLDSILFPGGYLHFAQGKSSLFSFLFVQFQIFLQLFQFGLILLKLTVPVFQIFFLLPGLFLQSFHPCQKSDPLFQAEPLYLQVRKHFLFFLPGLLHFLFENRFFLLQFFLFPQKLLQFFFPLCQDLFSLKKLLKIFPKSLCFLGLPDPIFCQDHLSLLLF